MMRSQTALWGKSESLSKCISTTLYPPSVRRVPVQVSTSTTKSAQRGSAEGISSALIVCLLFPHKHVIVYRVRCGRIVLRQRRGCCVKTWLRLIFLSKVHQICSDVWIDTLKVNSCSLAKSKSNTRRVSLSRTFSACEFHWRDWTGGRSRLCGLPCSFSQSKCSGEWRRCIKTWPGQQRGMEAVY